jgi:hypothetical protein
MILGSKSFVRYFIVLIPVALAGGIPPTAQVGNVYQFDRLSAFAGTWQATKPGEISPFLVLKIQEDNGRLSGSISHFKVAVTGAGNITGTPVNLADSPAFHLIVTNGAIEFDWKGDAPLHGGRAKLIAQGTNVGYLTIPVSLAEGEQIMREDPPASGFSPIIPMIRKTEQDNGGQPRIFAENWKIASAARLINAAEFQYRFANGVYTDYQTLWHSGELAETGGSQFTVLPLEIKSESDPLPGYALRLLVSPDGHSYQLFIQDKTMAPCAAAIFSNETGFIFKATSIIDCSPK